MNFVRKITNSDALKHIVDLPEDLQNQDVELIILPIGDSSLYKRPTASSHTARGSLKQYANLDLIQFEQGAWEKGVQDKHEHR
ncbi:hypothetical protein A7K91_25305 [Paenibacillus oryzae]|uniref:Uncharacterized protein n=1 Tax=Paenibacillus oryzae TaxID=1844972 RepID=A0A1A5YCF5_9BACL|nr:hypothetical protein [Paenibacillus oryzae]OBR63269.1 hypothetical protein A7K91_25305 [Paenibacillus oryzae]